MVDSYCIFENKTITLKLFLFVPMRSFNNCLQLQAMIIEKQAMKVKFCERVFFGFERILVLFYQNFFLAFEKHLHFFLQRLANGNWIGFLWHVKRCRFLFPPFLFATLFV